MHHREISPSRPLDESKSLPQTEMRSDETVLPLEITSISSDATSDETVPLEITSISSDGLTSISPHHLGGARATVGTLHLAIIVFYGVSGGPFGIEEAVRSAGPFFCLLGFLIGPLVWSIPEAAMTAELGSTYPDASGGVIWVEEAFGTQAGWTFGFLAFISGATDTAIYPALFLDYCLQLVQLDEPHPWIQYAAVTIFAVIMSYINYRGLPVIGNLSIIICIISMSPFIIAAVIGATQVQPRLWFRLPEGYNGDATKGWISRITHSGVKWRPFLNSLYWNLNSFDSAASFSAEVDDPARTFPRGMLWSVVLVACGYFIPLLVVLGISRAPQSAWVDGYMATAIAEVHGKWLETWLVLAAGVTNIALFQAEMASDAFQVMGMADRGYLPKIFSTRSQFGTPTYGILLGLTIVLLMSVTNLEMIIEILNWNYALSVLMEYAALLKLRISKPEVNRPFRIPLGTIGCFIAMIPTIGATVVVMALASLYTMVIGVASVVLALIIFQWRKNECTARIYRQVSSLFLDD